MDYASVKDEFLKLFSNIFIVDITNDKVIILKDTEKEMSFFDFVSYETPLIHPDDLKNYFDNLNISKLESNNGNITFNYRFKNENTYEEYTNYLKLFVLDNKKLILSSSIKGAYSKNDNSELENKLDSMSSEVSDFVLKIYNTLDSTNEMNSTSKYISNLLDNLIRKFPEFKTNLEKNMISQVSKVSNTILIIDDDSMTRTLLKKAFKDDFEILEAENGQIAIDLIKEKGIDNIEGIFLDLLMPVLDGFAVLDFLKNKNILSKVPVVIISGIEDKETRTKVYEYNVADMLEKPFNLEVIKYRTRNLINLYKTSSSLNNMVFSQATDLRNIIDKIVECYKYDYKNKIEKTKKITKIILDSFKLDYSEYGLDEYKVNKIVEAVDLYDVGLYVIPRSLGQNGNLTEEEKSMFKNHPNYGKLIVERYLDKLGDKDLLKYSSDITLFCHENFVGSGYPNGIKEDDIPIWSQIVSVSLMLNLILSRNDLKSLSNEEIINKYLNVYNPKIINTLRKEFDEIRNIY